MIHPSFTEIYDGGNAQLLQEFLGGSKGDSKNNVPKKHLQSFIWELVKTTIGRFICDVLRYRSKYGLISNTHALSEVDLLVAVILTARMIEAGVRLWNLGLDGYQKEIERALQAYIGSCFAEPSTRSQYTQTEVMDASSQPVVDAGWVPKTINGIHTTGQSGSDRKQDHSQLHATLHPSHGPELACSDYGQDVQSASCSTSYIYSGTNSRTRITQIQQSKVTTTFRSHSQNVLNYPTTSSNQGVLQPHSNIHPMELKAYSRRGDADLEIQPGCYGTTHHARQSERTDSIGHHFPPHRPDGMPTDGASHSKGRSASDQLHQGIISITEPVPKQYILWIPPSPTIQEKDGSLPTSGSAKKSQARRPHPKAS